MTAQVETRRVYCAVPVGPLVQAVHMDWWQRIAEQAATAQHACGFPRGAVRGRSMQLVGELLRGTRTVHDRPVDWLGPLPVTPEVGGALIAVLTEWHMPASIIAAASVAVGDAR